MKHLIQLLATPKHTALFLGACSLFALLSAGVMQFGFGLYPCTLCVYQRIPYAILLLLCLALYLARSPAFVKALLVLCSLALLVEIGLAFYHVGVEEDIFAGTSSCSPETSIGGSLEELKAAITAAPIASCKDKPAALFGLSLAAWNGVFALFLMACQLYVWCNPRKEPRA